MPRYFNVRRINLTTTDWTDVMVPEDCSQIYILNEDDANSLDLRSDKGNSETQMTLLPSATLKIQSGSYECPFVAGAVVCSLRATVGAGPIVVQFIR